MKNTEIAKILYEIGECLEMQEVLFKPRAYEKAANAVESFEEDVSEIYRHGGLKALEEIPGVGVSIAEKIEELITNGRCAYHEQLKKKTPVNLSELTAIEGVGPKMVLKLYKKLGVKNLNDLERAARRGKIRALEGFGEKSEEHILKGIQFLRASGGRFVLGFVMPQIREIERRLQNLKNVERVVVAGSARRKKETIGDVDMLVIARNPKSVMDYFASMPEVINVYAHGETKSAVKLKNGMDVDLRVVPHDSFGAALNYFTGSKAHNIALREIAQKKGWKLNEYGLFKTKNQPSSRAQVEGKPKTKNGIQIAGKTEDELYKKLGMDYIEPEMREGWGEIQLAQKHSLPELIGYNDLRGDLQVQTNWTDGANTIEEMAREAIKLGMEYIAITDHTKRLAMTGGLDEKKLLKQMAYIDGVNSKSEFRNSKFRILKGTECDILKDGTLDIRDDVLAKLDVVGVSVHSHFNLSRKDQTERIIRAMKNPHADIVFHPTGRLINRRQPYEVDMEAIIAAAKKTGTVLEIDAYPDRLDLKDEYIRKCVEAGVNMSIDSDAHSTAHFHYLEFGIAQARRGWASRSEVVNAWGTEQMLARLK
ncbi:MAG: DNA polymerase III [Parcubacteria group bacterium RIFCSPLOWO2_01_FULL_48_18]|nr:MAG: DNA polymerase III [Parcubacteria group bacterium RIFCSPHIGHO2_02_FULL_48_10b]OHB23219.1 MAG: DNA polymerase III [Parcubacteria group bacterium RIFCSPLOWO2_01_FULL_48_18]